jgi:hypothetical protein
MVVQVEGFFKRVIDFVIGYIEVGGSSALINVVRRILDDNRFFYMQTTNLVHEVPF